MATTSQTWWQNSDKYFSYRKKRGRMFFPAPLFSCYDVSSCYNRARFQRGAFLGFHCLGIQNEHAINSSCYGSWT